MKHRFIALLTMAACLFPLCGEAAARKFVHQVIILEIKLKYTEQMILI